MALINCPECEKEISDRAFLCPNCGFLVSTGLYVFEYRSKTELFGLPLLHVVCGPGLNPRTGRPRVAKGIVAVGPIAVGLLAMGGLSLGVVSLGGLALGLASVGGLAIGLLLALGGFAVGLLAVGGGALGYYAIGGGAWGVHAFGANVQDPNALELFKRLVGS